MRPLSVLTTCGAPQPAGSAAGSGSRGSTACQRLPTMRLMSRTASRTTHGMSYLHGALAGAPRRTLPARPIPENATARPGRARSRPTGRRTLHARGVHAAELVLEFLDLVPQP